MLVYIGFDGIPLLFTRPEKVITCLNPSDLPNTFRRMENALNGGYYLAGFISYEAGACLERALSQPQIPSFPLVSIGCYPAPSSARDFTRNHSGHFRTSNIETSLSFEDYSGDIGRIRSLIASGDVYQVTYCIKMKFNFSGNGRAAFSRLFRAQPVPYPAYIAADNFEIASLSPEMLLKKKGASLKVKPMKGTWRRGRWIFPDLLERTRFGRDGKNRAENVMITDLLRNDIGRIGHDVRVDRLCEITGYRKLFQMTSSISAGIAGDIPLSELFGALLPSGSVTGAPKIRAMEAIRSLEKEERKIYTGAIGYITPARDMYFNVPIRTLLIEKGSGEMGIGGGIVWDSTVKGEWEEGLLKAKFLTEL